MRVSRTHTGFLICVLTLGSMAVAMAEPVTLEWTAVADGDLSHYIVYWGTSLGSHPNNLNVGNVTQVTIGGLNPAMNYYFVVTAVDTSDNESTVSVEVSGRPRRVISW